MIFLELFWTFLKIGAFTFGGGYAMIPLIQSEVSAKGWMDGEMLVNFVAVSESTPGPMAINMATFVGAEMAGVPGAICATLGVVLPSFGIILLVARCYTRFRESRIVRGCMSGLRPAVVGLIAAAALSVGETVFLPGGVAGFDAAPFGVSLAIFAVALGLEWKKLHPIAIICISALLGIAAGAAGLL